MNYDVYFHNDFDGRASAAVMLAFLRSRGDDIERFVPLGFDILPQWRDEEFFRKHKFFRGRRNPAIVVDFPYHPKAVFWFDHHPTTFQKESWRKKFRPTKFRRCNPEYKSACHFAEASLKNGFGWKPPEHFKELIKWLDIIDGAYYKSARQTLEIKEPALQIDAFIDKNAYNEITMRPLIELLSRRSLKEIASDPRVKSAAAEAREKIKLRLAFYRKNIKVRGKVTFIDLTLAGAGRVRFAPFYLYPRTVYAIRIERKDGFSQVGIGANSWRRKENELHIGELLRKYGGGGHKDVGGVLLKDKKDAEKVAKEIIARLSGKRENKNRT